MKAEDAIEIARSGERLKQITRSGWSLAGVVSHRPESVADHCYGTTLLSLIVGTALVSSGMEVDMGKLLMMAALHDLPESLTSDIPRTAVKIGGRQMKRTKDAVERRAMHQILANSGQAAEAFKSVWNELEIGVSLESRIVQSCDVLDMILHATALEESGVSPAKLDKFFVNSRTELKRAEISLVQEAFSLLHTEHRKRMEKA